MSGILKNFRARERSDKKYRYSLEIVRDMLLIASVKVRKTRMMYQANLSYRQSEKYLKNLLDSGLMECHDDSCYLITKRGKDFLQMYDNYVERSGRIGEEIKGTTKDRLLLENMCFNNQGDLHTHRQFLNADEGYVSRFQNFSVRTQKKGEILDARAEIMRGVVLAAGEGSRIRKVTYGAFPKELLPIGNVPTIRFPIEVMKLAGIKDLVVVIAPQTKHGIIDGLQSGGKFDVNISYAVQEKNEKRQSGLGSAILSARGSIRPHEDFAVACGDTILCDFSLDNPLNCLKPLISVHKSVNATATVMVYPAKCDPTRFGVVKFRSLHEENGVIYGELEDLVEKPNVGTAKSFSLNGYHYIIAGYYVFKHGIFSYIEKTDPGERKEIQITDAMALALKNGERIYAVVHGRSEGKDIVPCEYWDVGIPEDYRVANKKLSETNLDTLLSFKESIG